jgi:hypothetical protein
MAKRIHQQAWGSFMRIRLSIVVSSVTGLVDYGNRTAKTEKKLAKLNVTVLVEARDKELHVVGYPAHSPG